MMDILPAVNWHALAVTLLGWLAAALVFGTTLALLTAGLLRLFRGHRWPGLEIALWIIVLVKFLLPVGPQWSLSLASLFQAVPGYDAVAPVSATGVEFTLPQGVTPAGSPPSVASPLMTGRIDWAFVAAEAYLLAVALFAIARYQSYRAFRARCLTLPRADTDTIYLVREVCARLNVARVPPIRVSDESRAPFVLGLLSPILVLSRRQIVRPDELETVVVHEVAHLRRGDLIVRALQCVAGTVLFFWPVVAWVNRRIDRAREHDCDKWALRHGKLTAGAYARCLLEAVQPAVPRRVLYQPACMAGHPSTIERRIDVILTTGSRPLRRPIWGLGTMAFVLLWGGFALTGAVAKDRAGKMTYEPTEQDMRRHADAVYAQVSTFESGDVDGNGEVCKEECWAFVTAAVLAMPDKALAAWPEADRNGDGQLEGEEAYLYFRGDFDLQALGQEYDPLFKKAEQAKDKETIDQLKKEYFTAQMSTWHVILDRRAAVLDLIETTPDADEVRKIYKHAKKQADKDFLTKLDSAIDEVIDLQKKAAGIRKKVAHLPEAEARDHLLKADSLEERAAEIKSKVVSVIKEEIDKLQDAGKTEKVTLLQEKLAKIESL
jgi:beta-lactamase regulating signal transducer with metallopeptidase domain